MEYLDTIIEKFGDCLIDLEQSHLDERGNFRHGFLLSNGKFLDAVLYNQKGFWSHSHLAYEITGEEVGDTAVDKLIDDGHVRFSYYGACGRLHINKPLTEMQAESLSKINFNLGLVIVNGGDDKDVEIENGETGGNVVKCINGENIADGENNEKESKNNFINRVKKLLCRRLYSEGYISVRKGVFIFMDIVEISTFKNYVASGEEE